MVKVVRIPVGGQEGVYMDQTSETYFSEQILW